MSHITLKELQLNFDLASTLIAVDKTMCIIKEEHKLKIIQLGLSEYIKILNLNEPIGSFKKYHLVICTSLGILSPQ